VALLLEAHFWQVVEFIFPEFEVVFFMYVFVWHVTSECCIFNGLFFRVVFRCVMPGCSFIVVRMPVRWQLTEWWLPYL